MGFGFGRLVRLFGPEEDAFGRFVELQLVARPRLHSVQHTLGEGDLALRRDFDEYGYCASSQA